ncbi:MAG: Dps family protein [Alkalibacterium gilvum]|uniref:Starvation-inducible DNA-binding protein n=2 Tax=Alkalibacterium gilvum TaxID=1130080 RepID=A0A1H6TVB3_9LACT|nr:DNA starvation/stationary phase protection protein [Alkalibacterium gilvum]SEI83951.1 starvation-inducible DNA-binding protein [Alkalibacterium gilvum]
MKYEETKKVLNQLTADLSQASAAIHQIHWYLRGKDFKNYHELMDEYRETVEEQLDEVAERLIIIDGSPVSTLEEFAEKSNIKSVPGKWDKAIDEHLERLVDIFRTLVAEYSKGIEAAQEEGDAVTEDIFIDAKGDLELNVWMMQAELGKAPNNDA